MYAYPGSPVSNSNPWGQLPGTPWASASAELPGSRTPPSPGVPHVPPGPHTFRAPSPYRPPYPTIPDSPRIPNVAPPGPARSPYASWPESGPSPYASTSDATLAPSSSGGYGYLAPLPSASLSMLEAPLLHQFLTMNRVLDLDLLNPTFSATVSVSAGMSHTPWGTPAPPNHRRPLAMDELCAPATSPGITRLVIQNSQVPSWPIVLDNLSPSHYSVPLVITLGDVLLAIHTALHEPITHADWKLLSKEQEGVVAESYQERCGSMARRVRLVERGKGVKRVDYFVKETDFVRLNWAGPGVVEMVLESRDGD